MSRADGLIFWRRISRANGRSCVNRVVGKGVSLFEKKKNLGDADITGSMAFSDAVPDFLILGERRAVERGRQGLRLAIRGKLDLAGAARTQATVVDKPDQRLAARAGKLQLEPQVLGTRRDDCAHQAFLKNRAVGGERHYRRGGAVAADMQPARSFLHDFQSGGR